MTRILPAVIVLACGLPAGAARAACVTNATDQTLLFTIDATKSDARTEATLAPGVELCLPGVVGAVFRVFAAADEIEGCSRITGPTGRDTLIAFRRYDNCRWASHGK